MGFAQPGRGQGALAVSDFPSTATSLPESVPMLTYTVPAASVAMNSGGPGSGTVATICSGDYPINRSLQIYKATGSGAFVRPAEQSLLNFMDDPASRDPIIINNEFIALSQCP